jgi:hypothetical protein
MVRAVIRTELFGAVVTCESWTAFAFSVYTLSVVVAIVLTTYESRTVISYEGIFTNAFTVYTSSMI